MTRKETQYRLSLHLVRFFKATIDTVFLALHIGSHAILGRVPSEAPIYRERHLWSVFFLHEFLSDREAHSVKSLIKILHHLQNSKLRIKAAQRK